MAYIGIHSGLLPAPSSESNQVYVKLSNIMENSYMIITQSVIGSAFGNALSLGLWVLPRHNTTCYNGMSMFWTSLVSQKHENYID